jgi:DNA repair photolyase
MKSEITKTGTREWSEHSVNCCLGCRHGCLYCYARDQALRYKRIASGGGWTLEGPLARHEIARCRRFSRRYDGVVMFPTTHDWTAGSMDACWDALARLLSADNHVLLVTKLSVAHCEAIIAARDVARRRRSGYLEVRVSVGGLEDRTREFWEPHAPTFNDRIQALEVLASEGITVSASAEPLLEPGNAVALVAALEAAGAREVWIGKANKLRQRTAWRRAELLEVTRQRAIDGFDLHAADQLRRFDAEVANLEARQTDAAVMEVVRQLGGNPKVRWKDSYAQVIAASSQ